jgi:hypothetical protein
MGCRGRQQADEPAKPPDGAQDDPVHLSAKHQNDAENGRHGGGQRENRIRAKIGKEHARHLLPWDVACEIGFDPVKSALRKVSGRVVPVEPGALDVDLPWSTAGAAREAPATRRRPVAQRNPGRQDATIFT